MAKIIIQAFNLTTQNWVEIASIPLKNYLAKVWNVFGSGSRVVDEAEDGISPEFTNTVSYPKLRLMLDTTRSTPLNFSLRFPRYGTVVDISNLEYGSPQEIANFFVEEKARTWGLIYLDATWGPIVPPEPPDTSSPYVFYEDLTATPMTEGSLVVLNFVVNKHKYAEGSLMVYINQIPQRKASVTNQTDFTIEEISPGSGIFQYTGPFFSGWTVLVQYRVI